MEYCLLIVVEYFKHPTYSMDSTNVTYSNNDSNVYMTLIDASKAFDRVQYVKLFKLLLSINVCPVVARLLCYVYHSVISCQVV